MVITSLLPQSQSFCIFLDRLGTAITVSVGMKYRITTLLLAAIPIQLRFTSAFPSNSYSGGNGTLNKFLPVNITYKSTPQTAVTPSTNLTSTNLTFSPWPSPPFSISWPSNDYHLGIEIVSPEFPRREPIDLTDLLHFIDDFANNVAEQYPPPAVVPRRVSSTTIDGKTFTRWTIDSQRTLLGRAVPSQIFLLCLDELNILLRRHGPASIETAIYKGNRPFFYSATLFLAIENLADNSLNIFSLGGNSENDTS